MPKKSSNGPSNRDDSLITHIALLYYKEGLNQNDIAKRMGLSRATVVNYLRESRDRGIVDIRVNGKPMTGSKEARALRDSYGLKDVYVAYVADPHNPEATLSLTAEVAASAFRDIVEPNDRIGVAWGQTMMLMAEKLTPEPIPGVDVCQMIGAMDTTRLLATETCAIEIASKLDALCHTLHSPALLSSPALAEAIRKEPTIQSQLERLSTLDCLFSSLGHMQSSSHLVAAGIVTHEEIKTVAEKGGVGFFCSRFFTADGSCLELPLYERMIAASLEDIQKTPKRVLVASGLAKTQAVHAAILGGFATHLIVDQDLAQALLSLL